MKKRFTNLRVPSGGDATAAADILVSDGIIQEVRSSGASGVGVDETIDLRGALVLPGCIDGHVHFDDPGFTHRENFATGTRAAAAGGVTCIVDMPCTSLPPVTTLANLENKLTVIKPKAHVDFMLWGGVSGNALATAGWREHLAALVEAGVAAIKVYMLSGMETFTDLDRAQIRDVLEETRRLGIPVGVHAEDRDLVRELAARLQNASNNDPLDYAASRPSRAEVLAVSTLRDLCRETGARIHVVHVASGDALDVISDARAEGLPMSAETCPQYLAFTDLDLARLGAVLKTAPVVKSRSDQERLWRGLASGELEYVATDHAAGQWPEEKHTGSIWSDYGGVPGVELMLPYLYSAGVSEGRITLDRLTEITASAPARFFGIAERKGRIEPGLDADLVVLDETARWTVRADEMHNLNRYTPLDGQPLTGRVTATYVRGQLAYERRVDGTEFFAPEGTGAWVRRQEAPA